MKNSFFLMPAILLIFSCQSINDPKDKLTEGNTNASGIPGVAVSTICYSTNQILINWGNPAGLTNFDFVVLKQDSPVFTQDPTNGQEITNLMQLGNAMVVYQGTNNSWLDTSLLEGTRYYYRVYVRDGDGKYSPGSETQQTTLAWFTLRQNLPTSGARHLKAFHVGENDYLAVAQYFNMSTRIMDSPVYIWNTNTALYELLQNIPTIGAYDIDGGQLGSIDYMAIANSSDGSTLNLNSEVLYWNNSSNRYVHLTNLATRGGFDMEAFTMNNSSYLGVVFYSGTPTGTLQDSPILKWDIQDQVFRTWQTIPTWTGCRFAYFTNQSDSFLVSVNQETNSNTTVIYETYAIVRKYNPGTDRFETIQALDTSGAMDVEGFMINGELYMAIAYCNNNSGYNLNSRLYKYNGSSFDFIQNLPGQGTVDFEFFTLGDQSYLFQANSYTGASFSTTSVLYAWNVTNEQFQVWQNFSTKSATKACAYEINGKKLLAVACFRDSGTASVNSLILEQ